MIVTALRRLPRSVCSPSKARFAGLFSSAPAGTSASISAFVVLLSHSCHHQAANNDQSPPYVCGNKADNATLRAVGACEKPPQAAVMIGIQTKISILTVAIVLVTVVCLSVSQIYLANNDALAKGREGLGTISAMLGESVALQHTLMQDKVRIDRDIMRTQFALSGFPIPEVLMDAELDLIPQEGGESGPQILPAMKHGSVYLHENADVVRKVAQLTGGVASVLQMHDGRLVRISMSDEIPQTFWRQGSYMTADHPAYAAVEAGQGWEGLAYLGGQWRLVAYEPFTDLSGDQVLGALEIAHPLISEAFASYVRKVGIGGQGGTMAFDGQGRTVIDSPEIRDIGSLVDGSDRENGHFRVTSEQGRQLEIALETFAPWGMTFATWVATDDLMAGVQERLVSNALIGMIFPLVLSVILIGLAVRVLLAPVRRMAQLAEDVAGGNYTATISYPARDPLGHLAGALNLMVAKSREVLQEIVAASGSLSGASTALGAAADGLLVNSAGTARQAQTAFQSASGVSENMHSVSAAMEQATVNVGMVAASTTELAATIQGVAQSADLAKRTTADAVSRAGESARSMAQLRQAAKDINAVSATIAAISSQTNLLALNATIEAARAGTAGRGFAVVAGEIKELSRQTSEATDSIKGMVQSIQAVSDVAGRELAAIIAVIDEVNEIIASISETIEEQSGMTGDISASINQAAKGLHEISANVALSSSMTREISHEVAGVLDSSRHMQSESDVVQQRAESLAGLAADLQSLVSRFRFDTSEPRDVAQEPPQHQARTVSRSGDSDPEQIAPLHIAA